MMLLAFDEVRGAQVVVQWCSATLRDVEFPALHGSSFSIDCGSGSCVQPAASMLKTQCVKMSRKTNLTTTSKDSGKALKVASCAASPKARTAYALFLASRLAELANAGPATQNEKVRNISAEWRLLDEHGRAHWKALSAAEFSRKKEFQMKFIKDISQDVEMGEHCVLKSSLVGSFETLEAIEFGQFAATYLVKHKEFHFKAIARIFSQHSVDIVQAKLAFQTEVEIYNMFKKKGLDNGGGPFCEMLQHSPCQAPSSFVIIQYMPMPLSHWLKTNGKLKGTQLEGLAAQLAGALDVLHQHDYYHGDLKPGNILYDPGAERFKLVNFHLSIKASSNCQFAASKPFYTGSYRPPEVWAEGATHFQMHASTETWPYGCTVFEAATATVLFTSYENISRYCFACQSKSQSVKGMKGLLPPELNAISDTPLFMWMLEILKPDVNRRPPIKEVLDQGTLLLWQER